jgi:AcrR family transcriptional regulator
MRARGLGDRRVQRTRRQLREALLALLGERRYEAISIQGIVDRANVGRSTFYAHFASKDALLYSEFDGWLMSLVQHAAARGEEAHFRFSLPLLRHISEQRRFAEATIAGSAEPVRARILTILAKVARRELSSRHRTGSRRSIEGTAHAVAGAFLGTATWWLRNAPSLKPEAVDHVFQAAVAHTAIR